MFSYDYVDIARTLGYATPLMIHRNDDMLSIVTLILLVRGFIP